MDIARIHIRFYGANSFIRGQTMIFWVTDFNMFSQYKRMWWLASPRAMSEFMKLDEDLLIIIKPRAFVTITPVGIGLAGRSGDMDEAISAKRSREVINEALPSLLQYAHSLVPDPGIVSVLLSIVSTLTSTQPGAKNDNITRTNL